MSLSRQKDSRGLGHLFETLQEGVYVGRIAADGTTTLAANPQLRLIFGWAADVPVGDIRPLDSDRFVDEQARTEFLQNLARDGQVRGYVLRLRRADGSAIWTEVTARAEPITAPTPRKPARRKTSTTRKAPPPPKTESSGLHVEAIMRDVTERRKLQDQSRDLYHQLSQAEKLAALGQTMSGVAHELNNPLATILACAERLSGRRLDELTRRDLDAIHNAAERAARIVRNLQTFARKRHTTRTTVDLNQVVRETLALRAY